MAIFFIWASLGEIDIVVRAQGVLRHEENTSLIRNTVSGIVVNKNVSHGQMVKKGATLWKIDARTIDTELAKTRAALERKENSLSDLYKYESAIVAGRNTIDKESTQIYDRAIAYFSEKARLDIEIQIAKDKLEREKNKPHELIVPVLIKEQELNYGLTLNNLDVFQGKERVRIHDERTGLIAEIESLENTIAGLQERAGEAEIKSPLDGIYDELKMFNVGDYFVMSEEIARIIPLDAENLKVELTVDPRDIAEIAVNMKYYMRFNALAPARFGQIEGMITHIPADAQTVSNLTAAFILYGTIENIWVTDKNGYYIKLKSGMVADCRIIINKKTILVFLLEKLNFII
ncbi:MAG: HlyD family secretion protein [Treponema sp.]|jgi:adhesin transport system membrane fusion protein|nr:HlyD family secretion protein [Treponema sp.]